MNSAWLMALFLGWLSTLHCVGMCGGLSASIGFMPQLKTFPSAVFLIHGIRIITYALLGFILSPFSNYIQGWQWGEIFFRFMAALMLFLLGIQLWSGRPMLRWLEKIGGNLSKPFLKSSRLFKSENKPIKIALLFGMGWGLFPCGMVYSALIWSVTQPSQNFFYPSFLMMIFGIGTLPGTLGVSLASNVIQKINRHRLTRPIAGFLLCATALWTLISPIQMALQRNSIQSSEHTMHQHH
ncbi:MAG: sulfite exporter TauE/SafE family protein [Pseudomonadota bacterium]